MPQSAHRQNARAICATSLFLAFLAAPISTLMAQTGASLPVLHRGGRTDVLVYSSALENESVARRQLSGLVGSCRSALTISPGDSASVAELRAPAPTDAVDADASTITLSLLPVDVLQPSCGKNPVLTTLAASRGLRITFDTTRGAEPTVSGARVLRNGQEVVPLSVQRLPIIRLGNAGLSRGAQTWLRVTLPLDAFAYPPSGDDPGFSVDVETGGSGAPDRVLVPGATVRSFWRQLLPYRAAKLEGVAAPSLILPTPTDARLQEAHAAYGRGEMAVVARIVAGRLMDESSLSRLDRVYAYTSGAIAFEALGDRPASNVMAAELVQVEPCFDVAAEAPVAIREALRSLRRPAARCTVRGSVSTAAHALVLPGFGRPRDPETLLVRSLVGASVLATSVIAFQHNEDGKSTYDEYVRWRYFPSTTGAGNPAVDLYNKAEQSRQSAISFYQLSAALYIAQAAWAVWAENRHAARVEAVRSYGRTARQARITPVGRDGTLGVAITITW
jgi:hypothetical protein